MSSIKRNLLNAANGLLAPFGVALERAYYSRTGLDARFPMTRALCASGTFENEPLFLIDVGCSGGIDERWRIFGQRLAGIGIDAMAEESARLARQEGNPNIKYVGAQLAAAPDHPVVRGRAERAWPRRNPWARLSTALAVDLLRAQPRSREETLGDNEWTQRELSQRQLTVEELVASERIMNLDFIKIDIDGRDYEILAGFGPYLDRFAVLGVKAEVNFFGTAEEEMHSFHNTDRFLRRHGFELFALSTCKYSSAALPAPFKGAALGPTSFGKVYQGDAVYFRDPAGETGATGLSPTKLLKLACMFELFELPDCAAEILVRFGEEIGRQDTAQLLDLLVPRLDGARLGYQEYLARFNADPRSFI